MRIDDNTEALAMMKRALGSLEGKFREAYNKGFHDGRKEGRNEAKQEMANKILREVEDESNCSEKPNNCDGGIYLHCNGECGEFEDEPQTEVETMSCEYCKYRPIGAEICDNPCSYEPKE